MRIKTPSTQSVKKSLVFLQEQVLSRTQEDTAVSAAPTFLEAVWMEVPPRFIETASICLPCQGAERSTCTTPANSRAGADLDLVGLCARLHFRVSPPPLGIQPRKRTFETAKTWGSKVFAKLRQKPTFRALFADELCRMQKAWTAWRLAMFITSSHLSDSSCILGVPCQRTGCSR